MPSHESIPLLLLTAQDATSASPILPSADEYVAAAFMEERALIRRQTLEQASQPQSIHTIEITDLNEIIVDSPSESMGLLETESGRRSPHKHYEALRVDVSDEDEEFVAAVAEGRIRLFDVSPTSVTSDLAHEQEEMDWGENDGLLGPQAWDEEIQRQDEQREEPGLGRENLQDISTFAADFMRADVTSTGDSQQEGEPERNEDVLHRAEDIERVPGPGPGSVGRPDPDRSAFSWMPTPDIRPVAQRSIAEGIEVVPRFEGLEVIPVSGLEIHVEWRSRVEEICGYGIRPEEVPVVDLPLLPKLHSDGKDLNLEGSPVPVSVGVRRNNESGYCVRSMPWSVHDFLVLEIAYGVGQRDWPLQHFINIPQEPFHEIFHTGGFFLSQSLKRLRKRRKRFFGVHRDVQLKDATVELQFRALSIYELVRIKHLLLDRARERRAAEDWEAVYLYDSVSVLRMPDELESLINGVDDVRLFLIAGWFPKELDEPMETTRVVFDDKKLFFELGRMISELRGWRRVFSLKSLQAFGLYECNPLQNAHVVHTLTASESSTLAQFFKAYQRHRSGALHAAENVAWADWVHRNLNNNSTAPFRSRLAIRLVMKWSKTRIIIGSLAPLVLSLGVGFGYMYLANDGDDSIQNAWTIASYIITASAFLIAMLAVLTQLKDG